MNRRILAVLFAAAGLLLAGPALGGPGAGVAYGHAQLVSSNPGAGEVLLEEPDELRLAFSEPLEEAFSSFNILNRDWEPLYTGLGEPDPADPFVLVAVLDPLERGGYLIEWRALSAADGHTTKGFLSFGVRDFPLDHELEPDGGSHSLSGAANHGEYFDIAAPPEILGRTLGYAGLFMAFGLLPIGWLVLKPAFGRLPRGVAIGQAIAVAVGIVGAVLLGLQVASRAELPLETYFGTSRTGVLISQRIIVGVVGLIAVLALLGLRRFQAASIVAGLSALAGLVLLAFGGHASAFTSPAPMVAMIVHLVAAAVWVAGLVVLAALAKVKDRPSMSACVSRFSALAILSIGLLAATGLYADWTQTRDVFSLETGYQFYLAVKVALVAAALGLGGLNFLDGGEERKWFGGLRLRVGAEVGLVVAILLVTANLGSGFPPATERPIAMAQGVTSAQLLDPAEVTLNMGPARPGPNRFTVYVDPPPLNEDVVAIELDRLDISVGPQRLYMNLLNEDLVGRTFYVDGGMLPPNSRWEATVTVANRQGTELAHARYSFALDATGLTEGREAPAIDVGFLLGLLLLSIGVLGAVYAFAGGSLPRCHVATGRIALAGGGVIGGVVGMVLVVYGSAV